MNSIKAFIYLINLKHFNKQHPENNNIKLTNIRDKYMEVWLDNMFRKTITKKEIDNLISDQYDMFVKFIDKISNDKSLVCDNNETLTYEEKNKRLEAFSVLVESYDLRELGSVDIAKFKELMNEVIIDCYNMTKELHIK